MLPTILAPGTWVNTGLSKTGHKNKIGDMLQALHMLEKGLHKRLSNVG